MVTEAEDWGTLGRPDEDAPARLLHVVETPVATLRHGFYEGGATVPLHRHECATLVYGVGGPCTELRSSGRLIKRRLTFHPPGYEHSLWFAGPTHVLSIELAPQAGADGKAWAWPQASTPLPATMYDLIWRALLAIVGREPEPAASQALTALVDAARAFLAADRPLRLMELVDHIHATWRETQSVRHLSVRFGRSPEYLCRAFKRHMGVTIRQYSVLIRLDYARGLLWGTGMPIAEVANETGFSDQSHLTRVLADHSARTPLRLRWAAPCENLPPGRSRIDRAPSSPAANFAGRAGRRAV